MERPKDDPKRLAKIKMFMVPLRSWSVRFCNLSVIWFATIATSHTHTHSHPFKCAAMMDKASILFRFFFFFHFFCEQCHVYRYLVSNSLMNACLDAYAVIMPHVCNSWFLIYIFCLFRNLVFRPFLWKIITCTIWRNMKCSGNCSLFTFYQSAILIHLITMKSKQLMNDAYNEG